jgi:hypothetical protein
MGEIRVKVLLTNSVDEALCRRKKLKKSAIRRYAADAMVDTGAVRSIIQRMSWRLSASCLAATESPSMPMGGPRLLP